jgi:hypothetical protein
MLFEPLETPKPSYGSYQMFQRFLEDLREPGVPERISKDALRTLAHPLTDRNYTYVRATLRHLELMRADGTPEDLLAVLVYAKGEERKKILRQILQNSYPFILGEEREEFDLATARDDEFSQRFERFNFSKEIARKAESFFLNAAKDAGLQISRHIIDARQPGGNSVTSQLNKSAMRNEQMSTALQNIDIQTQLPTASHVPEAQRLSIREELMREAMTQFPAFDTSWDIEEKKLWFEEHRMLREWIGGN